MGREVWRNGSHIEVVTQSVMRVDNSELRIIATY